MGWSGTKACQCALPSSRPQPSKQAHASTWQYLQAGNSWEPQQQQPARACTSSPQTQRWGWNAARIAPLLLSLRSRVARGVEVASASGMLCMDRCAMRRATPCASGGADLLVGAGRWQLQLRTSHLASEHKRAGGLWRAGMHG